MPQLRANAPSHVSRDTSQNSGDDCEASTACTFARGPPLAAYVAVGPPSLEDAKTKDRFQRPPLAPFRSMKSATSTSVRSSGAAAFRSFHQGAPRARGDRRQGGGSRSSCSARSRRMIARWWRARFCGACAILRAFPIQTWPSVYEFGVFEGLSAVHRFGARSTVARCARFWTSWRRISGAFRSTSRSSSRRSSQKDWPARIRRSIRGGLPLEVVHGEISPRDAIPFICG